MKMKINLELLEEALNEHAIVSMTDASGNIIYANQKFLDISGYSLAELLDKNHRILKSGVHSPLFYQAMWDTILSGKTWFGDVCNKRKNGDFYWVRATIKPIFDRQGLPVQYLSIRTEITEEKQQALIKQEFETLYHLTRDGVAILDLKSNFLAVNPAYERITGFTEAELLKTSCVALSRPADVPKMMAVFEQVVATGHVDSYEKTFILEAGKRVIVDMSLVLMPDKQQILVNIKDISEKREMEQALYLAKEQAEVTLACIGDAVITTDPAGMVTFLNPVATHLTGWELDDALNKPLLDIFNIVNEDTRQKVANPVDLVLRDGKTIMLSNHMVLISRGGTEYNIEDSAAPIFRPDGALIGCVLVFHDVTEKKRFQNNLHWQAVHDTLTLLPNRALLSDRFKHAMSNAQRQQTLLATCMIDLDEFKPVNDL